MSLIIYRYTYIYDITNIQNIENIQTSFPSIFFKFKNMHLHKYQ